jgi:membrane-associated phospholipid phosphatase
VVRSVRWVALHHKYSFPSGHATSVFTAAVIVSLFFLEKKWIAILCFAIAVLTAYSRVYLGEHFVMDVWMGSFIGVFTGTCCFLVQEHILNKR